MGLSLFLPPPHTHTLTFQSSLSNMITCKILAIDMRGHGKKRRERERERIKDIIICFILGQTVTDDDSNLSKDKIIK